MRKIALVLLLFWPSLAAAGILNVEFKFTPFLGDPARLRQSKPYPAWPWSI